MPARVIASNIISTLLNITMGIGLDFSETFKNEAQPYETIFKIDTIPVMKEYIKQTVLNVMQAIDGVRTKKVNKIVNLVMDYLNKKYFESELSLNNVAKEFYLNPSYLSRIFKQETGQTFVEYLTKLRMEKAINLIKETDKRSYQISEEVGINDAKYFSICFKKYTGMTVNDFKKG